MQVIDKAEQTRALNDDLRRRNKTGTFLLTAGVVALGPDLQREIIAALVRFDDFGPDNDPYGEHDFGAFTVRGNRLFFKIDAYDRSGTRHSPDPTDPAVTRRVLTLMLAHEY